MSNKSGLDPEQIRKNIPAAVAGDNGWPVTGFARGGSHYGIPSDDDADVPAVPPVDVPAHTHPEPDPAAVQAWFERKPVEPDTDLHPTADADDTLVNRDLDQIITH